MRYIYLVLTLFVFGGCAESVLDPKDLGGGGSARERIYFNTSSTSDLPQVKCVYTDNGEVKVLASPGLLSSAPVGNKLVFVDGSDLRNTVLYLLDLGSNAFPISLITEDNIQSATLSPDGSTVIYTVLYENGGGLQYCILKSIALDALPLSVSSIDSSLDPSIIPTFSPNGSYVAYSRLDSATLDALVIYDMKTKTIYREHSILFNVMDVDLEYDWMPDGRHLVCALDQDVKIISIDDGSAVPLNFYATTWAMPILPVVSSEGKIAAVGMSYINYTYSSDIWVYDGTTWSNISLTPQSTELLPHFSKDGKKITYSAINGSIADPSAVSLQTIPPSTLQVYTIALDSTRSLIEGTIVRPLFGR